MDTIKLAHEELVIGEAVVQAAKEFAGSFRVVIPERDDGEEQLGERLEVIAVQGSGLKVLNARRAIDLGAGEP
jgi:hypothetical protein